MGFYGIVLAMFILVCVLFVNTLVGEINSLGYVQLHLYSIASALHMQTLQNAIKQIDLPATVNGTFTTASNLTRPYCISQN